MADGQSKQDVSAERKKQADQMKMRRALDDAYGALEGQKNIQSFTAFTFEEALDNQIERISGTSSRLRPNELDRVSKVRENLTEAITAIKKAPPESFLPVSSTRDVNTP
jgi:hypothetical protein